MKNSDVIKLDKTVLKDLDTALNSLLELCQIYHLPMFATVAVCNDDEKTEYKNIVYNPKSHAVNLTDDKIRKHILVSNGFDAVPARESLTLDMEEVLDFGEDI